MNNSAAARRSPLGLFPGRQAPLPDALARKCPNAGREWGWQWVFPASSQSTGFLLTTPKLCSMMICSWYSLIPTIQRRKAGSSLWANPSKGGCWWWPIRRNPMRFASSVRGKQPAMSEESMRKKSSRKMDDELRPEYDFRALRVVARGPGRKTPHETTVRLASDVAETFPDSESVNEALRFLIRITKGQINTESRLR